MLNPSYLESFRQKYPGQVLEQLEVSSTEEPNSLEPVLVSIRLARSGGSPGTKQPGNPTARAGASRGVSIAARVGLLLAVPLLARARPAERRNALLAAGVGAAGLAHALGLVGLGADELITRNLLTTLVPLVVAVAVVLGGSRAGLVGLAAAVLVCGVWVGVNLAVARDPGLQLGGELRRSPDRHATVGVAELRAAHRAAAAGAAALRRGPAVHGRSRSARRPVRRSKRRTITSQ
jgi:hypothetical protein